MDLKKAVVAILFASGIVWAQSWELVWADEFDYSGPPDPQKWSFDVEGNSWAWGNNELQNYTDESGGNAWVENGNLIIEARKEEYTHPGGSTRDYTSARLRTIDKGDWLYGRIEVRAKLPGGRGTWPAIWMLPTDWEYGSWPSSGEIDIMEYVGYDPGKIHWTVHTEAFNHTAGTQVGESDIFDSPETDFYTYAIEWFPDRIDFLVDEQVCFTFENQDGYTYREWPFNKRFHLLLNVAVGGNWGGVQGVDDDIFPVRMEVDYVRVYALDDGSEYAVSATTHSGGSAALSPVMDTYPSGTEVSFMATPEKGSVFDFWGGTQFSAQNPLVQTVRQNIDLTAYFRDSAQLAVNGDFNGGFGWVLTENGDGSGSVSYSENKATLEVVDAGADPWSVNFFQTGIGLVSGQEYTLSFSACADRSMDITAGVGMSSDPWLPYTSEKISLNHQSQEFLLRFTYSDETEADSRIFFDCGGGETGTVTIENVSLRGEGMANGNSFRKMSTRSSAIEVLRRSASRGLEIYNHFDNSYTVSIINVNGRMVGKTNVSSKAGTVDIIELPGRISSGVFLLRIEEKSGKFCFTERVVF